jgi:hypothetical protein
LNKIENTKPSQKSVVKRKLTLKAKVIWFFFYCHFSNDMRKTTFKEPKENIHITYTTKKQIEVPDVHNIQMVASMNLSHTEINRPIKFYDRQNSC